MGSPRPSEAPSQINSSPHDEYLQTKRAKKTKKEKLRAHCARFWICWVVFVVVALAVGLPVLYIYTHLHFCEK